MSLHRLRVACLGVLIVLVGGCSTLPVSGEVHTRAADSDETVNQALYFEPPGPNKDDSQEAIVRGFLLAMQANPPNAAVARSFLSKRAKRTWQPNEGTIVYDAATVDTEGGRVAARLRGAHRLSPNGVWLDGTDASTLTFPLILVQEDGEWRLDNPPDALAVPASYFSSLFVGYDLFFFDRTGSVLVPTRVYIPPGKQTATNLVRGLLAGPPPAQRDVAGSAFPPGLDLDLAVVVSEAGTAEVPLEPAVLDLSPTELNRVVVQLAWTLRQVPGITRLKLTVDGAPVPLSDGRTDVSVSAGAEYDPLVSAQRELLAISDGRVVQDDGDSVQPVAGPFGQAGFALRSLTWSTRSHAIAAVSDNGRRVFVAPDRGGRSAAHVVTVLDGATNALRPAYDRFGNLWVVDAAKSGAVVHLLRGGRDRVLPVQGISGRPVSAFTLTRDGTMLVAVLGTGSNPTIEVSNVVRGAGGRVRTGTPARTLQVSGADLGPARDVVQNSATSVAVLTRPISGPDRIAYVELDGSPGQQVPLGSGAPETVPSAVASLVASPDPALALRVVTADGRLFTLAEGGRWARAVLTGVVAATYAY
jgi:hypothetical protein